MRYPVNLTPDTGGYFVTFPDIPEAMTQGDSYDEALEMAKDVLESALEFYVEFQRPIPVPSELKEGQLFVDFNPNVLTKDIVV